jgi:hypothetical protein
MFAAYLLLGLWLLGMVAAVARRSWLWFGIAAAVGAVAALLQGGAADLVAAVHEDRGNAAATSGALLWVGLGSLLAAGCVAWRRKE